MIAFAPTLPLPGGVLPGAIAAMQKAIAERSRRSGAPAHRMGLRAEQAVRRYLHAAGYQILGARILTAAGELDIVALRGRAVVIVEVKASARADSAAHAVDARKRRRVIAAAEAWQSANPAYVHHALRFDVALCNPSGRCEVIEDAFQDEAPVDEHLASGREPAFA